MMREIKFRAWDNNNKVMHNDFKFISSGDDGNDWIIFISDKYLLKNHDTNPFINPNPYFSHQLKKMQFTGLLDKNDVEIYEGDIVTYDSNQKRGWIAEVKWDERGLWLPFNDDYHTQDEQWDWLNSDFEVIGNIYENTELLDRK